MQTRDDFGDFDDTIDNDDEFGSFDDEETDDINISKNHCVYTRNLTQD